MASSRVGVRTSAWTCRSSGSMAASSGRPNAAVLPVPVWATPVMSRPDSRAGIASAWIGDGTVKPRSATARWSAAGRVRSAKVIAGATSAGGGAGGGTVGGGGGGLREIQPAGGGGGGGQGGVRRGDPDEEGG